MPDRSRERRHGPIQAMFALVTTLRSRWSEEVRHTILRLIGDHYRRPQGTHRSWQGCDLDLTGVTIDCSTDFSHGVFSGGKVSFAHATYSGCTVSFSGATFSSDRVSFTSVRFFDGEVSFSDTTDPAPSGLLDAVITASVPIVLPSTWLPMNP
ncbi:hypothetical protein ACWGLJ_25445 [Streptomyces sp. NPDC055898]